MVPLTSTQHHDVHVDFMLIYFQTALTKERLKKKAQIQSDVSITQFQSECALNPIPCGPCKPSFLTEFAGCGSIGSVLPWSRRQTAEWLREPSRTVSPQTSPSWSACPSADQPRQSQPASPGHAPTAARWQLERSIVSLSDQCHYFIFIKFWIKREAKILTFQSYKKSSLFLMSAAERHVHLYFYVPLGPLLAPICNTISGLQDFSFFWH